MSYGDDVQHDLQKWRHSKPRLAGPRRRLRGDGRTATVVMLNVKVQQRAHSERRRGSAQSIRLLVVDALSCLGSSSVLGEHLGIVSQPGICGKPWTPLSHRAPAAYQPTRRVRQARPEAAAVVAVPTVMAPADQVAEGCVQLRLGLGPSPSGPTAVFACPAPCSTPSAVRSDVTRRAQQLILVWPSTNSTSH